jgi:hypothetical protein
MLNTTNNQLSPSLTEHNKATMNVVENPSLGLRQVQK